MTLTRIAEIIHEWMGWCPMTAAVQNGTQEQNSATKPASDGNSGPVERRVVLYMRLAWIVMGFSWIVSIAALPYLPEIMPVHWNIFGQPDGFSGKLVGAFNLPVILSLIVIFLSVLPRFEKMRQSLDRVRDIYAMVIFVTASFLLAMQVMVLLSSVGMDLPVAVIFPMLFGFLFIVLGSLFPHIGWNKNVGIRLPWTLRDENVWKKTHEKGGPVFVIAGVLMVLGSPVAGMWAMSLMLFIFMCTIVYITVWSYRLSKSGSNAV
jgi:uncharacterized membrane protein